MIRLGSDEPAEGGLARFQPTTARPVYSSTRFTALGSALVKHERICRQPARRSRHNPLVTAQQLNALLCSLVEDLNRETTVDRVVAGDPNREATGVAVCWMPYRSALQEAHSQGANIVVTHEPTFYDHFELKNAPGHPRLQEAKEQKARLIDELGLTVIRCHDVWDAMPKIGVPFEWGRFLGLEDMIRSKRYMNLYRVEPKPAIVWAKAIAERTSKAGQGTVEFYGDPERAIGSIGVGTGCYSEALEMYEFGADLAVTVDDIARAWIVGEYCNDVGNPLVVVNHGVSEACAMDTLAATIRELAPEIPVRVLPQGASYREVRASESD